MKKLITNINGGMPDLLDNIRWMEAGMVEAIESICKGLAMGHNSYKVFGAEVTRNGTSVSVGKGVIYHNGEIFNVEPASFTAPVENVLYWGRVNSYHPSGNLIFQNGQQHDVYLERRMVLKHASQSPIDAEIIENHLISLKEALEDYAIDSGNLTIHSPNFQWADDWDYPRWNRKADGTVFMTGAVMGESPLAQMFSITFPSFANTATGLQAAFMLPAYYNNGGESFVFATVNKAAGNISIVVEPNNPVTVHLSPIILF